MKKKVWKKVLLVVGIAVLAVVVFLLINFYPMLSMSPAETGEINDLGIIAVNNGINSVYLIESDDGYILIDAGANPDSLKKTIEGIGVSLSEVVSVFLTHSDFDHVASLGLFLNAAFYMSENEAQMINGQTNRNGGSGNSLPDGIEYSELIFLKDQDELIIGGKAIRCVSAPGHTPGSMLYLLDGQYLFTGDAFMVKNDEMRVHPFTMDENTSALTIKSLYSLIEGTTLTLTSHYGYYDSASLRVITD